MQYHLQEFEATWQMSVPDDMTTQLSYLEVAISLSLCSSLISHIANQYMR